MIFTRKTKFTLPKLHAALQAPAPHASSTPKQPKQTKQTKHIKLLNTLNTLNKLNNLNSCPSPLLSPNILKERSFFRGKS